MNKPISPPRQIQMDATNRIDEEMNCLKCGYNLRGLLLEGLCPECGTPVGRSVHGDLLRFCSPGWVETLASGMNWIVASTLLAIAIAMTCIALLTASLTSLGPWVLLAATGTGCIVSLIGYWKATTPDPGELDNDTSLTARKLVRITFVASLAINAINSPTGLLPGFLAVPPVLRPIIAVMGDIVGIAATLASCTYARELALRIPDLSLAKQTRSVMWGMVVLGLAELGSQAFAAAGLTGMSPASNLGAMGPRAAYFFYKCVMSVGALVLGLWALFLLLGYRKQLVKAARQARRTWAKPPLLALTPPATT